MKKLLYSTDIYEEFAPPEKNYAEDSDLLEIYNDMAEANGWETKTEVDKEVEDVLQELSRDYYDEIFDEAEWKLDQILVSGSLGLWYGRRNTYFVTSSLKIAIAKCIDTGDGFKIYFDEGYDKKEHLFISVSHHDGTNLFILYALTAKGKRWAFAYKRYYESTEEKNQYFLAHPELHTNISHKKLFGV